MRSAELNSIEAAKRCAATVWQKVIVFFLAAGAFNMFVNRSDMGALAGSLAGLACLLAVFCACGFAYGYATSAIPATAPVERPVPITQQVEQQSQGRKLPRTADDDTLWGALIIGLVILFYKSDFSIMAMPATAKKFLDGALSGLSNLLGPI